MRHLLALLTPLALLASACADDPQEVGEDTDVETATAGEAVEGDVRISDGRRLELVEVREATGWTHLAIELGGGRLQVSSG